MLLLILSAIILIVSLIFFIRAFKKENSLLGVYWIIPLSFSLLIVIILPITSVFLENQGNEMPQKYQELTSRLENTELNRAELITLCEQVNNYNATVKLHKDRYNNAWIGFLYSEDVGSLEIINIDDYISVDITSALTRDNCSECNYTLYDDFNFCPSCGLEL